MAKASAKPKITKAFTPNINKLTLDILAVLLKTMSWVTRVKFGVYNGPEGNRSHPLLLRYIRVSTSEGVFIIRELDATYHVLEVVDATEKDLERIRIVFALYNWA